MTIRVPRTAPGMNVLIRMNRYAYQRELTSWIVVVRAALSVAELRQIPLSPVEVQIVRGYARHPLDLDNLYAASKIPLDAIRKVGIVPDDNPECVTALRCLQEKVASVRDEYTEIRIQPTAQ